MSSENRTHRPALRIAIVGTRGIPANYGGFETFAEELSTRLVERGHTVRVYGRSHFVPRRLTTYRGVEVRVLPALRHKYLETISHTGLSLLSCLFGAFDVVLVCNAANAFYCWLPGLAGQKVALNVDGIERLRKKWNWWGRLFYRLGELLATQLPDVAISDARVIQQYYRHEYGLKTPFIPYGASTERLQSRSALDRLGLQPGRYLLYVSRLEPENNAHLVMEAHRMAGVPEPLVVVGDAPYGRRYVDRLRSLAAGSNILLPGAIYGRGYRELLAHCLCFIQATEVGGTHPALIEAMGARALVLVNRTPENQEVVGDSGLFYPFNDREQLSRLISRVCRDAGSFDALRIRAQERVRRHYDWRRVVDRYEELFYQLLDGEAG